MKPQALAKRITAEWGERCPDHDNDCPVCRAWAWYDKVAKKPARD